MRRGAVVLAGLICCAMPLSTALAQGGFSANGALQDRTLPRGGWLGDWLSGPLPGKVIMPPQRMASQTLPMIANPPQTVSPPSHPFQAIPHQAEPSQAMPFQAAPPELIKEKWLSEWLSSPLPGSAEASKTKPLMVEAPQFVMPMTESKTESKTEFQPIHPLLDNGAFGIKPLLVEAPKQELKQEPKEEPKEEPVKAQDLAPDVEGDFNDPIEPFNRFMFGFNEILQYLLLHPLATAYNWLPEMVRGSVSNFLLNLKSPVILANDILQVEPWRAMQTGGRMFINTTVGLGGLLDVANLLGITPHDEDFGQTLAVWGVGEMFYLVLPVIGPTNPRDVIGKFGVDPLMDPFSYYLHTQDYTQWIWARTAASGFDEYVGVVDELDHIKSTSMDYYAAIRSMYRQRREREILNGQEPPLQDIPVYE